MGIGVYFSTRRNYRRREEHGSAKWGFAIDIGLGGERAFNNIKKKYDAADAFDTGIFGTDILTRVLFEREMCIRDSSYVHEQLLLPCRSFVRLFELSSEQIFESSNHFFVLPVLFV